MQSANYVPGVSGWKMHKEGRLEVEGAIRVVLGQPAVDKPEPKPLIVIDGEPYIDSQFLVSADKVAVNERCAPSTFSD